MARTPNSINQYRAAHSAAHFQKMASMVDKAAAQAEGKGLSFTKWAAQDLLPMMIAESREYNSVATQLIYAHDPKDGTSYTSNIVAKDGAPSSGTGGGGVVFYKGQDNLDYFQYVMDLEAQAMVIVEGEIPQTRLVGHPETLDIPISTVSTERLKISEQRVLTQRYAYLNRLKDLANWQVGAQRDKRLKMLVDAAVATTNQNITVPFDAVNNTTGRMTKTDLVNAIQYVADNGFQVSNILIPYPRLMDVFVWGEDDLTEVKRNEILDSGAFYKIWNIPLIEAPYPEREGERVWNKNEVYLFADPQDVGRMPIVQTAKFETSPTVDERLEYEVRGREYYGMGLAKPKAVAKITFATS